MVPAVLLALHRMVWADGDADPREIDVGVRVALRMLGDLTTEDDVRAALAAPAPPADADLESVPDDGRLIVLRAAALVAGADVVVQDSEVAVLKALGAELGLGPALIASVIRGLVADTAARKELDMLRMVAAAILGVTVETPAVTVQQRYRVLLVEAAAAPESEAEEATDRLAWAYHTLLG